VRSPSARGLLITLAAIGAVEVLLFCWWALERAGG